jgi:hypothetical protein
MMPIRFTKTSIPPNRDSAFAIPASKLARLRSVHLDHFDVDELLRLLDRLRKIEYDHIESQLVARGHQCLTYSATSSRNYDLRADHGYHLRRYAHPFLSIIQAKLRSQVRLTDRPRFAASNPTCILGDHRSSQCTLREGRGLFRDRLLRNHSTFDFRVVRTRIILPLAGHCGPCVSIDGILFDESGMIFELQASNFTDLDEFSHT